MLTLLTHVHCSPCTCSPILTHVHLARSNLTLWVVHTPPSVSCRLASKLNISALWLWLWTILLAVNFEEEYSKGEADLVTFLFSDFWYKRSMFVVLELTNNGLIWSPCRPKTVAKEITICKKWKQVLLHHSCALIRGEGTLLSSATGSKWLHNQCQPLIPQ